MRSSIAKEGVEREFELAAFFRSIACADQGCDAIREKWPVLRMIEDSGLIDFNQMCSKLLQRFDFLRQNLGKLVGASFQTVAVGLRTMVATIFRHREFGHGVRPGDRRLNREPARLAGWRRKMTQRITREAILLYDRRGASNCFVG